DGIRDKLVTGVQTCALPISQLVTAGVEARDPSSDSQFNRCSSAARMKANRRLIFPQGAGASVPAPMLSPGWSAGRRSLSHSGSRSEERRVGKECRYGLSSDK